MSDDEFRAAWAYESIVDSIPGVTLSDTVAVLLQFTLFEGGVFVLAWWYDLWQAVPAGTAAVFVATAGSVVMLRFSRLIRNLSIPPAYESLLFATSIEVVLGLLAYCGLLTYLFVADGRRPPTSLMASLFGPTPPAVPVYLMLLVLWDLCYRIGTDWWASVTGLWRTVRYRNQFDAETRAGLVRADLLTMGFALLQLLLVPFVSGYRLLEFALLGHVVAVTIVSGASALLLLRW